MNETGTAARPWMNPTESEQGSGIQIHRPSFRLIFGLEKTRNPNPSVRGMQYTPRRPDWLALSLEVLPTGRPPG